MDGPGTSSMPGPGGDSTNYKSLAIKSLIEYTPLITANNYSIWREKFKKLFKLCGIFDIMTADDSTCLDKDTNQEFVAHILAKLNASSYNNIIDDTNRDNAKLIWISTQEHFASSQSANRAWVSNGFLHLSMETNIELFVTNVKIYLKKMTKVGIKLPSDIIASLVLFKLPAWMKHMKLQIMQLTTNMKVDIVLNHLIQHKNKSISEGEQAKPVNVALYRGPWCENSKQNPEVTSHPASSCWFEFTELNPANAHNCGSWKGKPKAKDESHFYSFFCGLSSTVFSEPINQHRFILDSGCSIHMIVNWDFFHTFEKSNGTKRIQTGKKETAIIIEGSGIAALATKDANLLLSNATWVPESTMNLISLGALMGQGANLWVDRNRNPKTFRLTLDGTLLLSGSIINNLFVINMATTNPKSSFYSDDELSIIHQSLGHSILSWMEKFLNTKLPKAQKASFKFLNCDKAKITWAPFNHQQKTAGSCFEKIHLDLIGPINPTSKAGFRYVLTLVNSHLGYLENWSIPSKKSAWMVAWIC